MNEDSPRLQRVADQIQREIATLIQLEINDPRVGMVSVTAVDISRDMSYASIYITVLNTLGGSDSLTQNQSEKGKLDKLEIEENLRALNRAAGYLRTLLAKKLKLRIVPKLQFRYDASVERGQFLSSLIDDAIAADRDQH